MLKIDSSALIYGLKADIIETISKVHGEIVITPIVKKEVIDQGKTHGYSDAFICEKLLSKGKIKIHHIKEYDSQLGIGKGETETILAGIEEGCIILIDDVKARRVASKMGIEIRSTSIILLEALKKGEITSQEFDIQLQRYAKVSSMPVDELLFLKKVKELIEK